MIIESQSPTNGKLYSLISLLIFEKGITFGQLLLQDHYTSLNLTYTCLDRTAKFCVGVV